MFFACQAIQYVNEIVIRIFLYKNILNKILGIHLSNRNRADKNGTYITYLHTYIDTHICTFQQK